MGWERQAPLLCELNLLGCSYGAGWVNKESLKFTLNRVLLTNILFKSLRSFSGESQMIGEGCFSN